MEVIAFALVSGRLGGGTGRTTDAMAIVTDH